MYASREVLSPMYVSTDGVLNSPQLAYGLGANQLVKELELDSGGILLHTEVWLESNAPGSSVSTACSSFSRSNSFLSRSSGSSIWEPRDEPNASVNGVENGKVKKSRNRGQRGRRGHGAKDFMKLLRCDLKDMLPSLWTLVQEETGCQRLVAKWNSAEDDERAAMVQAALPIVHSLATHAFGRLLLDAFLDGNLELRGRIVEVLAPESVALSRDKHGCRVVQKALQVGPRESLLMSLQQGASECITHIHANHVIQNCVEMLPSSEFIVEAVRQLGVKHVASDKFGCRVILRLLEYYPAGLLCLDLLACTSDLIVDPYGNYVVQQLLTHGRTEDVPRLLDSLFRHDLLALTKHKHASRVLEKCVDYLGSSSFPPLLKYWRALLDLVVPLLTETEVDGLDVNTRSRSELLQQMLRSATGERHEILYIMASTNSSRMLERLDHV
eukprot:CAMPEP_0194497964 /NCGR_PEP_ID=MMETSP0253-20130528/14740_1 /TAXON_ID=2966 /ORGANISM="Noctiluca scintillans" /LENGTH=440 /DNA_ID=CAMNT_0039339531 /DNA_START=24 /DNA_END=1346 /DNA_ORIENTATION=-